MKIILYIIRHCNVDMTLGFIVLFSFRVAENPSLLNRFLLGMGILLSPLFKFSGMFFLPIPFIITLIIAERGERFYRLRNLGLSYAISTPFLLVFGLLAFPDKEAGKLSSLGHTSALLQLAIANGRDTCALLVSMLTPSVFFGLAVGSFVWLAYATDYISKRRVLASMAVVGCLVAPYVLLFHTWYPRYYLPVLVPFCMIAGELASIFFKPQLVSRKRIATTLLWSIPFLIFAIAMVQSLQILFKPIIYPQVERIREEYTTGWTSGYGLLGAVETISTLASHHSEPIRVVRSPKWDIPLQGLNLYYREIDPHAELMTLNFSSWNISKIKTSLSDILLDGKPTYLLFNSAYPYPRDQDVIEGVHKWFEVREVAHFEKPDGRPGLRLWHLSIRRDDLDPHADVK
jgi:hypothetical protein